MIAVAVLVVLLSTLGLAAWLLRQRYPEQRDDIVNAINRLLPQTQCAQCGYIGCEPYAQALAAGEAATHLCPPGGEGLFNQLNALLGKEQTGPPPIAPTTAVALIDETACIGCALCLPPCPVDAIAGAAGYLHTVIKAECTGCELCIPACPVDCISLVDVRNEPFAPTMRRSTSEVQDFKCVHCGRCDPVCPVNLPVQSLFLHLDTHQSDTATQLGINQCVECGLCDRACPADIPLASLFGDEKHHQRTQHQADVRKEQLAQRYDRHKTRLASMEAEQDRRRNERLGRQRKWH